MGDQWGGRDEIYWTASSNAHAYGHTTRTGESGAVTGGKEYSIPGDHITGSQVFFDTRLTGCGTVVITLWEADQSNAEWYRVLGDALNNVVKTMQLGADFTGLIPGLDLIGHVHTALTFLAAFWEPLRNKDDLVLSRGFALGRSDLTALYHAPNRRMQWEFNRDRDGMGRFSLYVRYTGDSPGAAPSGDGKLISMGWRGLFGTDFTRDLSAACNMPGSSSDVYLFKGDKYLRYDATTESIIIGPKSISDGWPGLRGTNFTSGIEAACAVPGSNTDVYLFKSTEYTRYHVYDDRITSGPKSISGNWPHLAGTFVYTLSAACVVPGSKTNVYVFKGDRLTPLPPRFTPLRPVCALYIAFSRAGISPVFECRSRTCVPSCGQPGGIAEPSSRRSQTAR